MQTIRAAVCHAFGAPLSIEEVRLADPGPGAVAVDLEAVAICHSDISYADGIWGGDLPAVYGHEAAGRIAAIGPGVQGLAVGERVVVTLIRACGTCAACSGGFPATCETPAPPAGPLRTADGGPLKQAMNCGAFAEKVVVDQSQVVPVGDAMSPEVAALLACGVITGVGAVVNAAGLRPGQDAVVIGAGGVGLNAIQGARIAGARRIVAVDLNEAKLADARAFGATDTVLAGGDRPWRAVHAALGRGADAVFVTVGAIPAYDSAVNYLGPRGAVVAVGMPATGAVSEWEPVMLAATGQRIIGTKMGDVVLRRDIPWMVDLYRQGRLELDGLVSRRWRFEQINAAIADTRAGAARRNVILF